MSALFLEIVVKSSLLIGAGAGVSMLLKRALAAATYSSSETRPSPFVSICSSMCAPKAGRVPGAAPELGGCAEAQSDSAVRGNAASAARRVVQYINLSNRSGDCHSDNNAEGRRLLTVPGVKQVKAGQRNVTRL